MGYSNISINEAISEIEILTDKKANIEYSNNTRIGDHKWYISNISKFKKHYPNWNYQYNTYRILKELVDIRNET